MNKGAVRPAVLVIGAALLDVHLRVPELPSSGGDVLAESLSLRLAGSAVLVASALKDLGVECEVLLRRGRGPLDRYVDAELRRLQIRVRGRRSEGQGGVTVTLVEPGGERSLVSAPGAESLLDPEDLRLVRPGGAQVVYVSGYEAAHSEALDAALGRIAKGTRVVFDPGPRGSQPGAAEAVWRRADVVRLNRREAELRTGLMGLDAVRAIGAGRPAVVSERDGAHLSTDGTTQWFPSGPPVRRDTTGAGDAHSAGLIAGIVRGLSMADAVRLANESARRRVLGDLGASNGPESSL